MTIYTKQPVFFSLLSWWCAGPFGLFLTEGGLTNSISLCHVMIHVTKYGILYIYLHLGILYLPTFG